MIIDTQSKVYFIYSDFYCQDPRGSWKCGIAKTKLQDYFQCVEMGESSTGDYSYYSHGGCHPRNSCAVYLGDQTSLDKTISSKINTNPVSTFKKVYFDTSSKFPRFKLSETTNIKRCLNPSKADSVILGKVSVPESTMSKSRYILPVTPIVLFSDATKSYYVISYLLLKAQSLDVQAIFESRGMKYTDGRSFYKVLIQLGIIPSDANVIYEGPISLIESEVLKETISNILNKYMLLTYDTELDKFVSTQLQAPSEEDFQTFNRMLSSSDESVVGMGAKLLSNYDFSKHTCSIGICIAQNWKNIRRISVKTSVGFQQVLSSINLTVRDLEYSNIDSLINKLYGISTSEEDKKLAKAIVIKALEAKMKNTWDSFNSTFDNLDLSCEFTIK